MGVTGAKVAVGKKGVRKTVGVIGTGISYTDYQPYDKQPVAGSARGDRAASPLMMPLNPLAVIIVLAVLCF